MSDHSFVGEERIRLEEECFTAKKGYVHVSPIPSTLPQPVFLKDTASNTLQDGGSRCECVSIRLKTLCSQ